MPAAVVTEVITPQAPPDAPPQRVRTGADLLREYTAASPWGGAFTGLRALPAYIDDLTLAFGVRVYEWMLTDPQVFASLSVLPLSVFAKPLTLAPPVPAEHPDRALAEAITRYCIFNLERPPLPVSTTLYELLEGALSHGHKLAELIYAYGVWAELEGPQLLLAAIKPKPLRAVTPVVDAAYNIAGYVAAAPGQALPLVPLTYTPPLPDQAGAAPTTPPLLPKEKFLHLTHRSCDGNPNGTSHLRSVYTAWWDKQQTLQEYLAYKATFARPGLDMELAEGADSVQVVQADGTVIELSAAEDAQVQLQAFRNGGIIARPHGSNLQPIEVHGEGGAFLAGIKMDDHQITKGLLMQSLATDEGEHQARAASQTHQDVLDILIAFLKLGVCSAVRTQLLRPLVRYAYGADVAERLTPTASLGETAHQDLGVLLTAAAKAGYTLDPSQFEELDEMFGFPVRAETAPSTQAPAQPDAAADDPAADDAPPPPPKKQTPPKQKGAPRSAD